MLLCGQVIRPNLLLLSLLYLHPHLLPLHVQLNPPITIRVQQGIALHRIQDLRIGQAQPGIKTIMMMATGGEKIEIVNPTSWQTIFGDLHEREKIVRGYPVYAGSLEVHGQPNSGGGDHHRPRGNLLGWGSYRNDVAIHAPQTGLAVVFTVRSCKLGALVKARVTFSVPSKATGIVTVVPDKVKLLIDQIIKLSISENRGKRYEKIEWFFYEFSAINKEKR